MATNLRKRWTPIEMEEVVKQFKETKSIDQVSIKFNKTQNAIIYALSKSLKEDKEKKNLTDSQLLEKYGVSHDELIALLTTDATKNKLTFSFVEMNNNLRLENEYIRLSIENKKLKEEAIMNHVDISKLSDKQSQQKNEIDNIVPNKDTVTIV